MKYITTKAEMDAERKLHPGEEKYKIFSVQNEIQTVLEYYWASDNETAYRHLIEYRLSSGREDVYFDSVYHFISDNDDGTVSVYDSIKDKFESKNSDLEDDEKTPYEIAVDEKKYMLEDFRFFVDHYDVTSGSSHNRNESWSLDMHILRDIEFNVPLIQADKNGVPMNFMEKAGADLGVCDKAELSSRDDVFAVAKRMWNEKLDELLHHVWLYDFYSSFGIVDDDAPAVKKDYLKDYGVFYKDGMHKVIDYAKMSEFGQREWKKIWEWMAEFGQNLWT